MNNRPVLGKPRLLLIEDDEDDYVVVREMLSAVLSDYDMDWIKTYEHALNVIHQRPKCKYDVYLIDYRLGGHNGLELVEEIVKEDSQTPIILLTGHGDDEIDRRAMKAGLADYLEKSEMTPRVLERSIRYSVERKQAESELRKYKVYLEVLVDERTKELMDERDKLREALADIKMLEGLLPICAWCRKIRNDRGYWMELEDYFSKNSQLQFSHGICPACREKMLAGAD